jgi:hypothetical protein
VTQDADSFVKRKCYEQQGVDHRLVELTLDAMMAMVMMVLQTR